MNAALRSIGSKDITVKINSPGGSVFEGFAIYNELRQHNGKVTVEVMGIAASAAAYIAMAGDDIKMGLGSFIMVHNAWGGVVGNRNDLAEAIETLSKIDGAQMDIFEARTGLPRDEIETYMNAETFFTAKDAVAKGFADEVFDAPKVDAQARTSPEINAKRRLEVLLAQTGVPRVERRKMINEATGGKQDAAPAVTHDADLDPAALAQLLSTIRS
jgi:ATP-dependent Clp endopeptidase proteolytic subunit ClpP